MIERLKRRRKEETDLELKAFGYNDVSVGDSFFSKFDITEEKVKGYVEAVRGNYLPGDVPNYFFSFYTPIYEALGGRIAQGTIHLRQKMEHYSKAQIGDQLDVKVTIKDKYRKNNRDYLVWEVDFLKDDSLVCRHETTHIWALATNM
jgi:hypothetical protein